MISAPLIEAPSRPVLRYHGGKWLLAPWIIRHFPQHRVYTECFGGAASVLLQKPRCRAEVYNDLDSDLVNVFRVLRAATTVQDLQRSLMLTPFSREEFFAAYEPATDPVERARRAIVRAFMGFGSAAFVAIHRTGFRANSNRSGTTPAQDWTHWPDEVPAFVERLRGVIVENRPALEILRQHDGPETLHYVDPPYVHSTRSFKWRATGQVYRHELTEEDHRQLAEVLHSLSGMVVLSGYACDLYDLELYRFWRRIERAAHADGARDRVEVLWLNPAAATRQQSLELGFPETL